MTKAEILALPVQADNLIVYATDTQQYYTIPKGSSGAAAREMDAYARL